MLTTMMALMCNDLVRVIVWCPDSDDGGSSDGGSSGE